MPAERRRPPEPRGRAGEPGRGGRHARAGRGRADHCRRLPGRGSRRRGGDRARHRGAGRRGPHAGRRPRPRSFSTTASRWQTVDERRIGADRLSVHRRVGRFAERAVGMTQRRSAITCACATRSATPSTWCSTRATATTSTSPASSSCAPPCRARRTPSTAPSRCQTVRQVIEWKAPARFDDVLEVSDVGEPARHAPRSSLSFEMRRAGETPTCW